MVVERSKHEVGTCLLCVLVLSFATLAIGQQNTAGSCGGGSGVALPAFEVATIKPFGASGIAGIFTYAGGRVTAGHLNLRMLVMFACNVQMFQIVSGPGWTDTNFFNLQAKPPETSLSARSNPPNPNFPLNDEQRQMLLALLIDRFQLKFHVENREGSVYVLERGKGDLKLQPPSDPGATPWVGGADRQGIPSDNGLSGINITMSSLAAGLSRYLGRPVVDRTSIQGAFDFNFKAGDYDSNVEVTPDSLVSTIFTSIQGIGLKLTAGKGTVGTIVIDHAELPSPN
jgi:uncharacterized protein (TIGR03435 family)